MANIRFTGTEKSETQDHLLQCYANDNNEIFLEITDPSNDFIAGWIALDEDTAVALSKHLRKQIAIIKGQ